MAFLVGLGAELGSLARHSLEAGLDAGNRAAGVACLTLQEVEASVFLQDGVRGAAGVTRHVFLCRCEKTVISTAKHRKKSQDFFFLCCTTKPNSPLTDISSQHIFYLFLLKSAFDHKLVISVYGTTVRRKEKHKAKIKLVLTGALYCIDSNST